MVLSSLICDFRSSIWLLRLMWRITSPKCPPRDQWFDGSTDADVRWLAEQEIKPGDENEACYAVLEARRELKRRGIA